VLVAIQILVNVHGAGSFAASSPTQQLCATPTPPPGTPR
jgi:hypothetical protein